MTLLEAITHIIISKRYERDNTAITRFDSEEAAKAFHLYVRSLSLPAEIEPCGANDFVVKYSLQKSIFHS